MLILIFSIVLADAQDAVVQAPAEASSATGAEPAADDVSEVVVVTGTSAPTPLSDAPVATRVIDRETLRNTGQVTLDQALEQTPGVILLPNFRGSALSIRGHSPEHVLILVDGRRTQGTIGGAIDLGRFPAERLERVEIVAGPVSSLYGADALGGVVQLITKRPDAPWAVNAAVSGGGYAGGDPRDARAVFFPAQGGAAGFDQLALDADVSFRQGIADGIAGVGITGLDAVLQSDDPTLTRLDGVRDIAPFARFGVDAGDHRLEVVVDGLLMEGRGADGTPAGARFDRIHRTQTWDGSLTGKFALPREVTLDLRVDGGLYFDALRQDQRGSDALDTLEQTTARLVRSVAQVGGWVDGARRHRLDGGAEVLAEDLSADRLSEEQVGRQRGAAWIEHLWRPLDKPGLTIVSGVRVDGDSRFGVAAAPRLALRLDPHRMVTLRVSTGSGWRAPDLRQMYLAFSNPGVGYRVAGNPDLEPERSLGVQADLTLAPHDLVAIDIAGWHDRVTNLILTDLVGDPVPGQLAVYGYVNTGLARVQGVAGTLRVGGMSPVQASVGWTALDADDLTQQRPLPGRPEHQGQASLAGVIKRIDLRATLTSTLLGPRPFYTGETATSAITTPWTGLLDLAVRYRPVPELELFAGVDNLLDAGDPTLDPTRPRRVYGGLRMSLAGRKPVPVPQAVAAATGVSR